MNDFSAKIIKIIKLIPYGTVSTYGTVATLAGSPSGARQVARILHSSSKKYDLPWH
ncbi:MAG: methylated-DNA-protein-cysteine methyltransferase-like protein, partial [Desulforhopalus sp.]